MTNCPYVRFRKIDVNWNVPGFFFQIEYFKMSLELILFSHRDINVCTQPGLNTAAGVVFQFLLLKSICCYHSDRSHTASLFNFCFLKCF